jgi:hypothetical protein
MVGYSQTYFAAMHSVQRYWSLNRLLQSFAYSKCSFDRQTLPLRPPKSIKYEQYLSHFNEITVIL